MKRTRHMTATATLYAGERTAVMVAGAFFMLAFGLYMYFLSASIVNVVMRQEIDHEIRETATKIAELEARYVAAKSTVTEDSMGTYGFTTAPEKTYVSKKSENVVLSRNDES